MSQIAELPSQAIIEKTQSRTLRSFPCEVSLIFGLVMMAFSVSMAIKSTFGVTTLSSVSFVLSRKFTILTAGQWNVVFQSLLLLTVIILTHKNLKACAFSVVLAASYGMLIDGFGWAVSSLPDALPWRLFYYAICFFLLPLSITLFVRSGYPALPFDFFVKDLSIKYHWKYSIARTLFDLACVAFSATFGLFALGRLTDVGLGTLISGLTTGSMVRVYSTWLDRHVVFKPTLPGFYSLFLDEGGEKKLEIS